MNNSVPEAYASRRSRRTSSDPGSPTRAARQFQLPTDEGKPRRWQRLLDSIKTQTISSRPWRVCMSYAPDQDNAEEQQELVQRIRTTLTAAGATDVLVDVGFEIRNLKEKLQMLHTQGTTAVVLCTPHYSKWVQDSANKDSWATKELDAIIEASNVDRLQVMPILWKGQMGESVPIKLRNIVNVIHDFTKCSFEDLMCGLNPLGIIPSILDASNDSSYIRLFYKFQLTNLPPVMEKFCGREDMLNELGTRLNRSSSASVTLTGLRGIGKTQLALAFAHKMEMEYDFCRFFVADCEERIKSGLARMAGKLKVSVEDVDSDEWHMQVHEKLRACKWLLLFDNVDNGCNEIIRRFFARAQQEPGQHILATSYSSTFKDEELHVDVFEPEDVLSMLKSHIPILCYLEDAASLGKRLGGLPLALSQAVAYMKIHGLCIPEYLRELKRIPKEVLSRHGGDDLVNYPMSVRETWCLSIKKIEHNSSDALRMLDCCAWLHADNIPLVVFEHMSLFGGDASRTEKAHVVLRTYSMISEAKKANVVKVHRLVQDVMLLRQTTDEEKKVTFKQLKTSLGSLCVLNTEKEVSMAKAIIPHLQHLLVVYEKLWKIHDLESAEVMTYLAKVFQDLGQPRKQLELLQRVLNIQKDNNDDMKNVAVTLRRMGYAYWLLGQPDHEKSVLEGALQIEESVYGPEHIEISETLIYLANAYGSLGNAEKKRELAERALTINEREHHGRVHKSVASALYSLANAYKSLEKPVRMRELLERALGIQEFLYGKKHFKVGHTLLSLSLAYQLLGKPYEHKDYAERSLKVLTDFYGPDHYEVAWSLNSLGDAYGELGQHEKNKELQLQVLKIFEAHYGRDNYSVAIALHSFGEACTALVEFEAGITALQRALSIRKSHYGKFHKLTLSTQSRLTECCFAMFWRFTGWLLLLCRLMYALTWW